MMIKNTTLSFLILTGMLSGSSANTNNCSSLGQTDCENADGCQASFVLDRFRECVPTSCSVLSSQRDCESVMGCLYIGICMGMSRDCENLRSQSDCENSFFCDYFGSCSGTPRTGTAAEGEALLSFEAAADDPNYDHHGVLPSVSSQGHKLLRGGQLAKGAIRLDSREYNGDNTISSFVKHLFQVDNDSGKSCCGECWCIPDNDNGGECPASTNHYPQVYTNEMVNDFSSKVLVHPDTYEVVTSNNLYELDCDPFDGVSEDSSPPWTAYQNTVCRLYPEQNFESTTDAGYSDAVCAFKYPEGDCNTYTYKTYPSRQEAEGDDAFVTHTTQCGACSSAQDLSVNMKETDLTAAGTKCTIKGIFGGFGRSVDCYMDLGFTKACATVWAYNSQHTVENCLLCGLSAAPSSECKLDPCVQCDAERSGPTFNAYSGRTRRNSGIRSELVRSCSSIENIQQYTCSDMILPDEEETSLCAV